MVGGLENHVNMSIVYFIFALLGLLVGAAVVIMLRFPIDAGRVPLPVPLIRALLVALILLPCLYGAWPHPSPRLVMLASGVASGVVTLVWDRASQTRLNAAAQRPPLSAEVADQHYERVLRTNQAAHTVQNLRRRYLWWVAGLAAALVLVPLGVRFLAERPTDTGAATIPMTQTLQWVWPVALALIVLVGVVLWFGPAMLSFRQTWERTQLTDQEAAQAEQRLLQRQHDSH